MKRSGYLFLLLLAGLLWIHPLAGYSQDGNPGKMFNTGMKYYNDNDYNTALTYFLKADSLSKKPSQMYRYYIGLCYLQTKYDKVKAIPYLEYSIKEEKFIIKNIVYHHLGNLYHYDYQFDKSILNFNKYLHFSAKTEEHYEHAERMIEICNNAKNIVPNQLEVEIENIGEPINTKHSEYSPLIAADESIIYFTALQNPDLLSPGERSDTIEHIYISYFNDEKWSEPKEINFDIDIEYKNLFLAGLSPDGELLLINIDGDIYSCNIIEGEYKDLKKLNDKINSEYWEGRASLTADGSELYFASDRPGGLGGIDIYKSVKDDNNNWGEPVNLGPAINTKYDEAAPFIHPDKKTLYFSSKGHNTIGGYDIFKSYWFGDSWYDPRNIGYPINTTTDDLYFVLSADGQAGYFSSSQNNRYNCHDIYKVYLEKSIALTLVKGKIFSGNPMEPVKAKIRVIDKETNTRVKYIYNPNPKTGKYLMIFPPGKNYDMIVEAEGYQPQLINIYIPNQSYFYELFQEIHLMPVKTAGNVVGEEVVIKNTFYDIYQLGLDTISPDMRDTVEKKDYTKLLSMIEGIIESTDSLDQDELDKASEELMDETSDKENVQGDKDYDNLFNLIEDAIETTDSTALSILEENTLYDEKIANKYFYAEDENMNVYDTIIIGNDTVFTARFVSTKKMEEDEQKIYNTDIHYGKIQDLYKKNIMTYTILFDKTETKIKDEFMDDLEQIAKLVLDNENLGLDIYGYSDTRKEKGTGVDFNKILAKNREMAIYKYMENEEIEEKRVVIKGGKVNESLKDDVYEPKAVIKVYDVLPDGFLNENILKDFTDFSQIKIEEINVGDEVQLNNIFFEFAKARLTPESTAELDNVAGFLINNKTIEIEVGGHTDNESSFRTNMKLSTARAKAVVDYLISKGVDPIQLKYKGYAYLQPIASNDTEEGRQQNRRVSFTILKK